MKRAALLCLAGLIVAVSAFAGDGKIKKNADKVPGQFIVVLNDNVGDPAAVADDLARTNGALKVHLYKHALKGFSIRATDSAAAAISADPRVNYVEEDGYVSIDATQTGATLGLDRVDQRDLPLNSTYVYNQTGTGVTAYIIDTGIRKTHAEFGGRAVDGTDSVDGLPADDCHGHGTHV